MKKAIFLALGWICFILGLIGAFIPVLPTTPLVLLAAILFARSSKRCETWLKKRKVYRKYVLSYKRNGGLTKKQKYEVLSVSYSILLISGLLISHLHVRILLVVIAITKLIVMWRVIPTVRQE